MDRQKLSKRMSTSLIQPVINASINKGEFPSFLNLADVIPVFKKGSKISKGNYWSKIILKNISKVYEIIM